MILTKAEFNSKVSHFFSNYLINRKTQYVWNHFTSLFFKADIGVGQESTLFPILSVLYIAFHFYIFEKRTKYLSISIPVSFISCINNRLFVS